MIVQCAMNGSYGHDDHPAVPVSLDEIVADARVCRAAGSPSVHLHPRRPTDGTETLDAEIHDAVVTAVRRAVPDLEISCSTQEDIDLGGAVDRIAAVRAWGAPPDVVSLNLAEAGATELGAALLERGIGIEAGVFTPDGVERLLGAPWANRVHRVLIEVIYEHDDQAAVGLARAMHERVAVLGRPSLWHGDARANWAVVDAAIASGIDARVGLEDTLIGRDGGPAAGNAAQVADTVARIAR